MATIHITGDDAADQVRESTRGSGGLPHGPGWYAVLPEGVSVPSAEPPSVEERRQRMGKRLRLMSDCGLFPLWAGGGLTPDDAREVLGLGDDLINDLQVWGWQGDSTEPVPGGLSGWRERGADLHRRLQEALGPGYEVRYVAE
jgi:hypothetical protein